MRYWSHDEATAYLPRLRSLIDAVRRVAPSSTASGNGHVESPETRDNAMSAARAALAELSANGIVLRDLSSGLIDFPSRDEDGVVYELCWRAEEEEIGWWHLPGEGLAGRKRVPRPGAGAAGR